MSEGQGRSDQGRDQQASKQTEEVESRGQSPAAQGAPLVAEEGLNEGTAELLEEAPEGAEGERPDA